MNLTTRYKICVSGAAETGHCSPTAFEQAKKLGEEIARRGIVLLTGATTGAPLWVAKASKESGGLVIGISPAASQASHLRVYHLPLDYHDLVIYTGRGYSGRNLLLTRAAEAVITVCGRIGTLNEFTIAFEDEKPIGVLEKTGGTADEIKKIVKNAHRGPGKIVYESDPAKLLDGLMVLVKKEEKELKRF